MAKDENGLIDNYPSTDMDNESLLKLSRDSRYTLQGRFEALSILVEKMYKQLHLLDRQSIKRDPFQRD